MLILSGPLLRIVSDPIDRYLARRTEGGLISPVDAQLLKDYLTEQENERGITGKTALTRCRYIAAFLRDDDEALVIFAAWRKKYKPNTFNNMVFITRKFLEWTGREAPDVRPEKRGKMTKRRKSRSSRWWSWLLMASVMKDAILSNSPRDTYASIFLL
jgi:hypothetical protein